MLECHHHKTETNYSEFFNHAICLKYLPDCKEMYVIDRLGRE